MIKAYWYTSTGIGKNNVGDMLTPVIVEYFTGQKVQLVRRNIRGKLLAVGSIMRALRPYDVVWGAGIMRKEDVISHVKQCKFLAIRGKLSEEKLKINCGVYGDPALLLPLMYNPTVEKRYKIGFVPHYVDKKHFQMDTYRKVNIIDVELPWQTFVDRIVECEEIVSSSLHGLIIAEAYGIPVRWRKVSDKVIGDGFKFLDYLTGTGREEYTVLGDDVYVEPIKNIVKIQRNLIEALKKHYDNISK